MIEVAIVTGFLGSGKTTLIGRALADPAFARSAVIVNEFGAIGLDHALMAASQDQVLTMANGCLCCAVQSDLGATLTDLAARRGAEYDRVLIETSGLADPAPVLQALLGDARLAMTHRLDSVLTLIDAQDGLATLDRHKEARRQVAMADRLALSKTDLGPPGAMLLAQLAALAPGVPLVETTAEPAALFAKGDPAGRAARLAPPSSIFARGRPPSRLIAEHGTGIGSVSLRRAAPLPGVVLPLWLDALAAHCGPKLLRLKGLVEIVEMPGRPAVLHAVGHRLAPPVWLDAWPDADHDSRVVIIAEDMPGEFPARLLAAIEAEVNASGL